MFMLVPSNQIWITSDMTDILSTRPAKYSHAYRLTHPDQPMNTDISNYMCKVIAELI